MAVSVREGRPGRSKMRAKARPSVREVCLLGVCRRPVAWSEGDRVHWSGRTYRVEATRTRDGGPEDSAAGYVHLAPLGGG